MDLGNEKHVCFINIFHEELHIFALLLADLLWEIMFLLKKIFKQLPFCNSNSLIGFLLHQECFLSELMGTNLSILIQIFIFLKLKSK